MGKRGIKYIILNLGRPGHGLFDLRVIVKWVLGCGGNGAGLSLLMGLLGFGWFNNTLDRIWTKLVVLVNV